MVPVTPKVNPYFEVSTFGVTWTIEFTLLLLSIEADNNWKESPKSFQLFSASIDRIRRVNSIMPVTRKVNPYLELFTFGITWTIGFNLLLLSIDPDNNWKEKNDSFQILSAAIERRRRVNSMTQITRKVNASK